VTPELHDPSLVVVSRNFSKTAQLLLNDIISHRLAGIFAKPLSDRDAPGYKDLVHRRQDLKSIKAALSKGGKAALAAIEALEAEDEPEEGNHETFATANSEIREGPIGNGAYLLKVSEYLVPPKGIVNSAQLEMELVRMFANAVMFNPLPTSERGFGRSLRLRKKGGDIGSDEDADTQASSSGDDGSPTEEGGIISDAREMFEDVLAKVQKWRELEVERLDIHEFTGTKTGHPSLATQGTSASASIRHSSTSSVVNDDDGAGNAEAATTPVQGTLRKRRRLAET
jgi:hypothetical protein